MSRPENDAEASTIAVGVTTPADRPTQPALAQPSPGSMVGRYRLDARLGAGGMGVVWSARDPELDRDVAIKLVHPALHSEESISRFRREARAMAKLSHRSVITVHDAGVVDGHLFLAMELVRGTTLGQMLRDRDAAAIADWPRWLAMLLDAGRGLAEAHKNGVLHRDFKPDNVLVDRAGRVCVGDFGLASLGDRPVFRPSSPVNPTILADHVALDLTTTGALLGTPLYMSPQQLNTEAVDERADQFAFCVALHEAMYGMRPFTTDVQGLGAIVELVTRIAAGVPPPPAGTTVPRAIHDCIVRGLAYEPEHRWPDMNTLIAALEEAQRRQSTPVPKRRIVPYAIAGAAVVGIGVAAVALDHTSPQRSDGPATYGLTTRFGTPLNTRTAISADGKLVALGSDVIEVRELDGPFTRTTQLPPIHFEGVVYLEVDDRRVLFSIDNSNARWIWHYRDKASPELDVDDIGGRWRGSTVAGELVRTGDRGLGIANHGKVDVWDGVRHVEVVAISPDRRRVAWIEGGRFSGRIVVRDVTTGTVVRSESLDEPTSLAWSDANTLLFAVSTLVRPEIRRVGISTEFGKPEVLFGERTGWYSDLGVGGDRTFVVSMPPAPRGRVANRSRTGLIRPTELDSVSVSIAWNARDQIVTWNASNLQVKPSAGDAPRLDTEPVSATMIGDLLIATLRARGSRRIVAVSLAAGGGPQWESSDKSAIVVRCAGDRAPPCFAIRTASDELDQVTTFDHTTGTPGTPIFESRRIEDLAVHSDGSRLVVVGPALFEEIDARGTPLQKHLMVDPVSKKGIMTNTRSVAYDPQGGFLVAGTVGRNNYQVGRFHDGVYEQIDEARDKILSLVRPSADGNRIVFVARSFEPKLGLLEKK